MYRVRNGIEETATANRYPPLVIRIPCTIDIALYIASLITFLLFAAQMKTKFPSRNINATNRNRHSPTQTIIAIDQVVLIGLTQLALVVVAVAVVADSSRGLVGGVKELNNDRART